MQEMLDRRDTVKEMRKTYDNWIDGLESKGLLSLNQQVNDVVGSMSSPETASLQDIFKTMATKVRYSGNLHTPSTPPPSYQWCMKLV